MKFQQFSLFNIIILSSFCIYFIQTEKVFKDNNKNHIDIFGDLDRNFNQQESCVICQYAMQKLNKIVDIYSQCPDMLDVNHLKERQRKWEPNAQFFSLWKFLFEANYQKQKLINQKIIPDGDHLYYIQKKNKKDSNLISNLTYQEEKLIDSVRHTNHRAQHVIFKQDQVNNSEINFPKHSQTSQNQSKIPKQSVVHIEKKNTNKILFKEIQSQVNQKKKSENQSQIKESLVKNDTIQFLNNNKMNNLKDINNTKQQNSNQSNQSITASLKNLNQSTKQPVEKQTNTANFSFSRIQIVSDQAKSNKTTHKHLLEAKNDTESQVKENKNNSTEKQEEKSLKNLKFQNLQSNCCMNLPCYSLPPCDSLMRLIWNEDSQSKKKSSSSFLQIQKHQEKNSQTQGISSQNIRTRSRFPSPQWNCVHQHVQQNLEYICEQEISKSFKKYCQLFKTQFNVLVESFLYQDREHNICEKLFMCQK